MAEQTFIESKTGTNTSRKIDKIKPRIWKKNLCKTFWFPKKKLITILLSPGKLYVYLIMFGYITHA